LEEKNENGKGVRGPSSITKGEFRKKAGITREERFIMDRGVVQTPNELSQKKKQERPRGKKTNTEWIIGDQSFDNNRAQ